MNHKKLHSKLLSNSRWLGLILQTTAIGLALTVIYVTTLFAFIHTAPNTISERHSQYVSNLQGEFWVILAGGTALFSGFAALISLWKQRRGAAYFNVIMLASLIFGIIAVLFFVYRFPYSPCDAPSGFECV